MHNYKTVLVAIDFSQHSGQALQRAKQIAQIYDAELAVIHVTEIPTYPVLEDIAITGMPGIWDDELGEKLFSAAQKRLEALAEKESISLQKCKVISGVPRVEIIAEANKVKADLIVIGRRGISGLQRLIGSTADAILHGANCDVLAVNIEESR